MAHWEEPFHQTRALSFFFLLLLRLFLPLARRFLARMLDQPSNYVSQEIFSVTSPSLPIKAPFRLHYKKRQQAEI